MPKYINVLPDVKQTATSKAIVKCFSIFKRKMCIKPPVETDEEIQLKVV